MTPKARKDGSWGGWWWLVVSMAWFMLAIHGQVMLFVVMIVIFNGQGSLGTGKFGNRLSLWSLEF